MIYLMQHGEALSKQEHPDRPLTERGVADVRSLARLLAGAGIELDDLFDSGKLRARQTAEILARELAPGRGPEEMSGLGATDSAMPIAGEIATWTRRVALVSHLPFIARLTGALVNGDEERAAAAFVPGTMLALQYENEGGWRIAWMVRPHLLRSSNG